MTQKMQTYSVNELVVTIRYIFCPLVKTYKRKFLANYFCEEFLAKKYSSQNVFIIAHNFSNLKFITLFFIDY